MNEEMPGGFKVVTALFQELDMLARNQTPHILGAQVRPTLPAIGGQGRRSTERQPKLDF
jgi:hypothetical protein